MNPLIKKLYDASQKKIRKTLGEPLDPRSQPVKACGACLENQESMDPETQIPFHYCKSTGENILNPYNRNDDCPFPGVKK